ncbi:MAG: HAD family hydrolase [Solirubrobacterales bacterium]
MAGELQAVLFDLDGTLMDHDAARVAGLRAHLAEWLPGIEAGELARLDEEWRRLEALHYEEYAAGRCSMQEQRRRRVRGMHEALGRAIDSDEAADEWFAAYLEGYRAAWSAFEDVHPALVSLGSAHPQAKLGVITNGEGEAQRAKLATIGLGERFSVVVASGEVGVAKPDPAIFVLACERLGVQRAQAAYVGDRLDLDAHGAAGAGLQGVWLDRPGAATSASTSARPQSIARIATLHELPAALTG